MKGWGIPGTCAMALLLCFVWACATDPGFTNYRQGMFHGTEALQNGNYQDALNQFLRASQGEPDKPMPLALAGQAAYQLGDYVNATRYLAQASGLDPNQSSLAYVIITGYQALIAFRENRKHDGMAALAYYIKLYGDSYPDQSLEDVKLMYQTGDVSVPGLELLINQQMNRYEKQLFG